MFDPRYCQVLVVQSFRRHGRRRYGRFYACSVSVVSWGVLAGVLAEAGRRGLRTAGARRGGGRGLWRPLRSVRRSRPTTLSRLWRSGRCRGSAAPPLPKPFQVEPHSSGRAPILQAEPVEAGRRLARETCFDRLSMKGFVSEREPVPSQAETRASTLSAPPTVLQAEPHSSG